MRLPRSPAAQAVLLLLVALATRGALFGDPVIHSDEQFYLLVGDRMLDGAWPYVDVFDRKPVGLFLIFAAIRLLGGDGVLAYQIAATLVAAATAFLVTQLANRFAGAEAAFGAGVFYLLWLIVFDGAGGQSAVWQNLPMAGTALIVHDVLRGAGRITARGALAMLLVGCAMQIKYVAMFEGIFFGLALLWAGARAGRAPVRLAGDALMWVAAALLPTAAAWAAYAAAGHGEAFMFANFLSIFGQQDDDTFASNLLKLAASLALATPLWWLAWRGRGRDPFPLAWCAAALVSIGIMHTFEQLYFLPLTLPLATASAAGLERGPRRPLMIATLLFGVIAASALTVMRVGRRGNAAQIDRLTAMIGQQPPGCLFTFGSEPILYLLTHSCLPTPYVFRSHLGQTAEAGGIGIDPVAETARLLAARPGIIVLRAPKKTTHPVTARLVDDAIAARYRRVGTVRVGELPHSVYALRR